MRISTSAFYSEETLQLWCYFPKGTLGVISSDLPFVESRDSNSTVIRMIYTRSAIYSMNSKMFALNRALQSLLGWSLEITLTAPFDDVIFNFFCWYFFKASLLIFQIEDESFNLSDLSGWIHR